MTNLEVQQTLTETQNKTQQEAKKPPQQNLFNELIQNGQKVTVYTKWFGQQVPIVGVIEAYQKPFFKLRVGKGIIRILNEHHITEVQPRNF